MTHANRHREAAQGAERERAFADWLGKGEFPEIKSAVQQRSIKTAFALLESAAALLRDHTFDALSIEQICAGADATVGAFYGRFENKQSFFSALQRLTCLRSKVALAEFVQQATQAPCTLSQLCHMMATLTVQRYRSNIGIYRAALKHADEGAWEQFRLLGDVYRQALTQLLSPHLPHIPSKDRGVRIRFAYQVMIGTLVHATLNDPGPLHLDDPAMPEELAGIVFQYLAG